MLQFLRYNNVFRDIFMLFIKYIEITRRMKDVLLKDNLVALLRNSNIIQHLHTFIQLKLKVN